MDFEDFAFSLALVIYIIFVCLLVILIGAFIIKDINTDNNTNNYQKCICEKVE